MSLRSRPALLLLMLVVVLSALAALVATPSRSAGREVVEDHAQHAHVHAGHVHAQAALSDGTTDDSCAELGLEKVDPDGDYCTHGPDPVPPGFDISDPVEPLLMGQSVSAAAVQCVGDGSSGPRVQMLYARPSNRADRYATFAASFQQWLTDADTIFEASAAETGGSRHIRFVHDAGCQPVIESVVLSTAGDDTFNNTVAELKAQGYNRHDRKYLIFMDAVNILCGIGTYWNDDSEVWDNANNAGPSYARADAGCWSGHTLAHELMHNLGAVQNSAPNSTQGNPTGNPGGHCDDEQDVMCYSDFGGQPPMRQVCANHEQRFDCAHDDYYHTGPSAGSYLDTHWNAAGNAFLIGGQTVSCPDFHVWEMDDFVNYGNDITLGQTQTHAFCTAGDHDWVRLTLTAGTEYQIETLDLAPAVDTILDLFRYDSSAGNYPFVTGNDNGGGAGRSLIVYTPTTTQTFYIRARQSGGAGSDAHTYDLRVSTTAVPDTTPPTTTHGTNPVLNAAGWAIKTVNLTLTATDDTGGSGVQHIQYSAAGVHTISTQTVAGSTANFQLWRAGETTVTYQATDLEGNVEAPKTLVVKIDLASPTVTTPVASLDYASLPSAGTTTVPVRLDWSGADTGSGIATYLVQRSTNGGTSWSTVATLTAPGWTPNVTPGVQYHYRVRAQDASGRWSAWSAGVPVRVTLMQESSAALSWTGAWSTSSQSWASGGSMRYASASGRSVTLTFTGREVAWIAPQSSNYGIGQIVIDGGAAQDVDLYAPTLQARRLVHRQSFGETGEHTLTIAVTGTKQASSSWTHVYVDALLILE